MIGERFREFRRDNGISTTYLNQVVGVDHSYIAAFERNTKDMPDETLVKILTKGFGISTTKAYIQINLWRFLDRFEQLAAEEQKELWLQLEMAVNPSVEDDVEAVKVLKSLNKKIKK